jgi:hypothetical protein
MCTDLYYAGEVDPQIVGSGGKGVMSGAWFARVAALLLIVGAASPVFAQSQAINGSIEGIVKDNTGAVLPV